jgi:hypothetical protein
LSPAATDLAGSAARTRRIGRGISNAGARQRGDHRRASDRHRQAETRQGLGGDGVSRAIEHDRALARGANAPPIYRFSIIWRIAKEFNWRDTEAFRQIAQPYDGEVYPAIFNLAEIGLRKARNLGERLLLELPFLTEAAQIEPNELANIHASILEKSASQVYSF